MQTESYFILPSKNTKILIIHFTIILSQIKLSIKDYFTFIFKTQEDFIYFKVLLTHKNDTCCVKYNLQAFK